MMLAGYHPEAEEELDDALSRSFNPIAFQDRVDGVINDICSGIVTYPKFNGTAARQCLLTPLPYSLIFTVGTSDFRIIAIAHHKRRPGYWKHRLK